MASARMIVVGGGVLGTMHAYEAALRGLEVVHLEREAGPRGASVRNFGLVWVSGRADGPELALARRARARWAEIAEDLPGLGFTPRGSITVARNEAEIAVAKSAADSAGAVEREFEFLDADAVRKLNPALRGEFLGGLYSRADGSVEPGQVLGALRERLASFPNYTWLPNRQAVELGDASVRDHTGAWHAGDVVVLATGATLTGIAGAELSAAPIRRCRLQMMQTEPLGEALTTSVADGDSFRYYPAYRDAGLDRLGPQAPVAAEHRMQLLMVQRADGGLTIGDTHAYDEPFDFAVEEEPYEHLVRVAEALLGRPLPKIRRRWAGVYCETTDGSIYHRSTVRPGVIAVTAPGGRGMTCSAGIAGETFDELDLP
ncbi:MAG TPA: TIGR03364 family FAD-dependent oxidoreductase [Actinospica sp.]|nr:TIGR03364 family FAD-dependent oxidoreductase [Actinospica sp.]